MSVPRVLLVTTVGVAVAVIGFSYSATAKQVRVEICHKGKRTLVVSESALAGHVEHGDVPPPCRPPLDETPTATTPTSSTTTTTGGPIIGPTVPSLDCGDGVIGAAEACDPAASPPGCPLDLTCQPDICLCVFVGCGNGILEAGEECDPSAPLGGCPAGQVCAGDCTCRTPQPACGDSEVSGEEECDDGNLREGDGCSSECRCNPATTPDVCNLTGEWYAVEVGATVTLTEDTAGNLQSSGELLGVEFTAQGTRSDSCGTGSAEVSGLGTFSTRFYVADSCDTFTAIMDGFLTITLERGVEPPPEACGDSEVSTEEECDDGNLLEGDGCSSECRCNPATTPEACNLTGEWYAADFGVTVTVTEDAAGNSESSGEVLLFEFTAQGTRSDSCGTGSAQVTGLGPFSTRLYVADSCDEFTTILEGFLTLTLGRVVDAPHAGPAPRS